MSKYIKVILIETIIVTIYVVSLYFYRTSTCSCTTGPHCAFSDDLFMCSMIWVVIEIILIPISLLLTKAKSIFIDIYGKK